MRKLKIAALAISVALSLTACDPPIPASVLVELAERSVQCETGDATVAVPTAAQELGLIWQDGMLAACADMTFSQVGFDEQADVLISSDSTPLCKPFARVPFSIDAAVFATNVAEGSLINLSAETAVGIFTGKITSWDDDALVSINPDQALPAQKIEIVKTAHEADIKAITEWLATLGEELPAGTFTKSMIDPQITLNELGDGAIALVPFSESLLFGASIASMVIGPDVYVDNVIPDLDTITSAATQWVTSKDETSVTVKLDPAIAPTPPEGTDEAPLPYQAIYPVELQLCGNDSLLTRAVGRFFLRLDQQGLLATSTMVQMPEKLRIAAAELVAKGLPVPEITEEPTE